MYSNPDFLFLFCKFSAQFSFTSFVLSFTTDYFTTALYKLLLTTTIDNIWTLSVLPAQNKCAQQSKNGEPCTFSKHSPGSKGQILKSNGCVKVTRGYGTMTAKSSKYMCITSNQIDTKSNPKPDPTTKQHSVVSIQLNIVTCPTGIQRNSYETMLLHRFYNYPLLLHLSRYREKQNLTKEYSGYVSVANRLAFCKKKTNGLRLISV